MPGSNLLLHKGVLQVYLPIGRYIIQIFGNVLKGLLIAIETPLSLLNNNIWLILNGVHVV